MKSVTACITLFCMFWVAFAAEAMVGGSMKQDIAEAVFRYQFERFAGGMPPDPSALYFLKVVGRDPDDVLLRRFSSNIPPVKKASQSRRENKVVIDNRTGKRGVVFFIHSIAIDKNKRAKVEGGHHENGRSAGLSTYYLKQVRRKWVVYKEDEGPIA